MGNLSLVALPANILILPFIPLTMGLGFLTGFAGLISYVLAVPAGFISYLFLHYELAVISFFSHLREQKRQRGNYKSAERKMGEKRDKCKIIMQKKISNKTSGDGQDI